MTAHQPGASVPGGHPVPVDGTAAGISRGDHPHSAHPPHHQPLNGASIKNPNNELVDFIVARRFAPTSEFQRFTHAFGPASILPEKKRHSSRKRRKRAHSHDDLVDFLFLSDQDPHKPAEVFDRLRWGGQVVFVSRKRDAVQTAAKAFADWQDAHGHRAFAIEQPPATERKYLWNLRLLGWRTPVHYMVARKVMLIPPGKSSDRFTYHVYLEKSPSGNIEVVKEVPSVERVLGRLREKFPDADEETLRRRARKFTDKIFPVFLTRETAMLKLLQRDLPPKFRHRVPHLISAETDANGYTRRLRMNWLRNARPLPIDEPHHTKFGGHAIGHALSQLEFARQAAELLTALHEDARVMHLDLRLDNVVITEHGVGFVDFGSAVRVGEEFPEPSLLNNLFDEMMRTSQIQRMLGKMAESGQVTSEEICNSYQKIDKAVDFFYLAVQINSPLNNPDFRGLVLHDKTSTEAKELAALTEKILRPENPQSPQFTSAKDILHGIEEIHARLTKYP